MQSILVEDVAT